MRDNHAKKYYESVRNRNKNIEIDIIAKNTHFNKKLIKRVYEHLFENTYLLEKGESKFDPDYQIALSWQRLREGKYIKEHDLVLLRHEALEHYLMNKYNYNYSNAHKIVSRKYDYANFVSD